MDKEIIAPYLPIMHELNLTPAQASKLIGFRQQEAERQIDERMQADKALQTQTEDALHKEWGTQYRANVDTIKGFLQARFGDAFDDLMNARTPSGDPLLGSPQVARALMQLALDTNGGVPSITLADGRLADAGSVAERKAQIDKLMADDNSEYWKGPNAERLQAEYRQLLQFEERNAARGGGGARR